VLDPHDAEINSNSKRQRYKNPTQPLESKVSPEVVVGQKVTREDQHQREAEDLSARGPGDTKHIEKSRWISARRKRCGRTSGHRFETAKTPGVSSA
jgi:hypothetical protein